MPEDLQPPLTWHGQAVRLLRLQYSHEAVQVGQLLLQRGT
jgi:hypothetical protein